MSEESNSLKAEKMVGLGGLVGGDDGNWEGSVGGWWKYVWVYPFPRSIYCLMKDPNSWKFFFLFYNNN